MPTLCGWFKVTVGFVKCGTMNSCRQGLERGFQDILVGFVGKLRWVRDVVILRRGPMSDNERKA